MWSHIDERRQHSKQVQRFGLASTGQTVNPGRVSSQSLKDWQRPDIAAKECPVDKIGTTFSEGHADRQYSLQASHGSGAVELSPLDPGSCIEQEQLDKPSGFSTRFAQMAEQPQHPNNHAKPIRRYFLRTKESELARAGSIPLAAPSLATAQKSQSRAVRTLHGLASAPGQLKSEKRIPDLFRTKRPSDGDLPHTSKKSCVRPTLSTAFCSTPFAQQLSARKDEFCSVSSRLVSAFDAPFQQLEEVNQENMSARDMMMKADDIIFCDESCDMMPCGMAPMPHSPMYDSEPVGFTPGLQMSNAGKLTPDATNQLGGRAIAVSPSVHTPPECMAAVHEQPPGAPRKRTKSASSSMSADSFDACESVFAPGAPDWSPRNTVCRVLKFDDDEMDG